MEALPAHLLTPFESCELLLRAESENASIEPLDRAHLWRSDGDPAFVEGVFLAPLPRDDSTSPPRLTLKSDPWWQLIDASQKLSFTAIRKRVENVRGVVVCKYLFDLTHQVDGSRGCFIREIWVLLKELQAPPLMKRVLIVQRRRLSRKKAGPFSAATPPPPVLDVQFPIWKLSLHNESVDEHWMDTWLPQVEVENWKCNHELRTSIMLHIQVTLFTFATYFSPQLLQDIASHDQVKLHIGKGDLTFADLETQIQNVQMITELVRRLNATPTKLLIPKKFLSPLEDNQQPTISSAVCGGVWEGCVQQGFQVGLGQWTYGSRSGSRVIWNHIFNYGLAEGAGSVNCYYGSQLILSWSGLSKGGQWQRGRLLWCDGSSYEGAVEYFSIFLPSPSGKYIYSATVDPFAPPRIKPVAHCQVGRVTLSTSPASAAFPSLHHILHAIAQHESSLSIAPIE